MKTGSSVDGLVHVAKQPLGVGHVVPQLAIQLASRSRLHSNGRRGSLSSLAHCSNLGLCIAFHLGDSRCVGSLDGIKCSLLLLLSGNRSAAKLLQSRCSGGSGSGSGCLLLLQLERERGRLLLSLGLELRKSDLGLSLRALQIQFALGLIVSDNLKIFGKRDSQFTCKLLIA